MVVWLFSRILAFFGALVLVEQLLLWGRRRRARAAGARCMSDLPGPKHLPILGVVGQVEAANSKGFMTGSVRRNHHKAFSMCFPLGQSFSVVTCDPKDLQFILSDPYAFPKGAKLRRMFQDFLGDGIFNSDGDVWKSHRKIASHLFSSRRLRQFSDNVFSKDAEQLAQLFVEHARNGSEIDAQGHFTALTLQSFCSLAFGVTEPFLDEAAARAGQRSTLAQAFDTVVVNMGLRTLQPWWPLFRWLKLGTEKPLSESLDVVEPFIMRIVEDRLRSGTELAEGRDGDLLSQFLLHSEKIGDPALRSPKQLHDVVTNFILAGRDTTASLLTSALRAMDNHPDLREKCEEEADRLLRESPDASMESVVSKAEYLRAFLLETLRLWPPVNTDFKAAAQACVLPGSQVFLEKHDRVIYQIWGANTHPEHWGEDCYVFDPSRWVEGTKRGPPAGPAKMLNFHFPAFNAGPRLCLGKSMAMTEAMICLTTLMKHRLRFTVTNPIPDDQWDHVWTPSVVIFLADGLKGKVSFRP